MTSEDWKAGEENQEPAETGSAADQGVGLTVQSHVSGSGPALDGVDFGMVLLEARIQGAKSGLPKLPWEQGVFSRIFGTGEVELPVPQVEPVSLAMPRKLEDAYDRKTGLPAATTADETVPVFEHVIKFGRGWKKRRLDSEKFGQGCEIWAKVVLTNVEASSYAPHVEHADDVEQEVYRLVKLALAGKSVATVHKRAKCMDRYFSWHVDNRFDTLLPVDLYSAIGYLESLKDQDRTSAMREFMETLTFGKHVIGIDVPDAILKSSVLLGLLRGSRDVKKPKKQSRVLEVREVQALREVFWIARCTGMIRMHVQWSFLCFTANRACLT